MSRCRLSCVTIPSFSLSRNRPIPILGSRNRKRRDAPGERAQERDGRRIPPPPLPPSFTALPSMRCSAGPPVRRMRRPVQASTFLLLLLLLASSVGVARGKAAAPPPGGGGRTYRRRDAPAGRGGASPTGPTPQLPRAGGGGGRLLHVRALPVRGGVGSREGGAPDPQGLRLEEESPAQAAPTGGLPHPLQAARVEVPGAGEAVRRDREGGRRR